MAYINVFVEMAYKRLTFTSITSEVNPSNVLGVTSFAIGGPTNLRQLLECEYGFNYGNNYEEYMPYMNLSTSLPMMVYMTLCPPGCNVLSYEASYT